jgi:hypothetical protein
MQYPRLTLVSVIDHLRENELTEPAHHALARTPLAEAEATNRAICLSNLVSAPILIVHVSSATSMARIRHAQDELRPIFAETCPQYLLMLANAMSPGHSHGGCGCGGAPPSDPESLPLAPSNFTEGADASTVQGRYEGAKMVCSPPLREDRSDLDAVWKGLANGTVTTFSSDHCPSRYNHPKGKKKGLVGCEADFTKIPNGLPGVETRLPLLMTYGVEAGRSESGIAPTATILVPCSRRQYRYSGSSKCAAPSRHNCMACNIERERSLQGWMRTSWCGIPRARLTRWSPTRSCTTTLTIRPSKARG